MPVSMIAAAAIALTPISHTPSHKGEMSYYCTATSGTSAIYISKVFTGPWGETQKMQDRWKKWLEDWKRPFDFASLNCRGFAGDDAYTRNRAAADASWDIGKKYEAMGYTRYTDLGGSDW